MLGAAGDRAIAAYHVNSRDEGKLTPRPGIHRLLLRRGGAFESYATLKRDLDSFDFSQFTDRDWPGLSDHKELFCDGVHIAHSVDMNQDYALPAGDIADARCLVAPKATEEAQS
ncbi:hypothetical protein LNQ52_23890 [Klebsiella pneumoniae subsp. pneumoniae]|nr:hypothetical protein [Klebsiella pneumoniae subsp. pneumoniae]